MPEKAELQAPDRQVLLAEEAGEPKRKSRQKMLHMSIYIKNRSPPSSR